MGASCTKSAAGDVDDAMPTEDDRLHLESVWAAQVIGGLGDRYESRIAALKATIADLQLSNRSLDMELTCERSRHGSSAGQLAFEIAEGVILIEHSPNTTMHRHSWPGSVDHAGKIAVGRQLEDDQVEQQRMAEVRTARVLDEEDLLQKTRFVW